MKGRHVVCKAVFVVVLDCGSMHEVPGLEKHEYMLWALRIAFIEWHTTR